MKTESAAETVREEAVNTLLAELMRERGILARAERRSHGDTPDIRVELRDGRNVFLECKFAGSTSQLERQLAERLEHYPEVLGVFGLEYPLRLKREPDTATALSNADDLKWWLHGQLGEVTSNHQIHDGSIDDLCDHLRVLIEELEGEDLVVAAVEVVGQQMGKAANAVLRHARIAWRIAQVIARTDQEKDRAPAVRIACLMLFNAIAFQDRLSRVRDDVPGIDESRQKGVAGQAADWDRICSEIDYVPVFELALEILRILSEAPGDICELVIDSLTKAAKSTRPIEGHDVTGRLFHTLLTDAKFKGAYYTSVPAATLLTRLAFEGWPEGVDWSDHEFASSLDIADLACGTGTLLMAVAAEAERRHIQTGGQNAPELHKAMVEQALHGFDVQLSAVHFAATSLAMLNPEILFDRMSLYVMPLGEKDGGISLGSLDFLGRDEVAVQFAMPGALDIVARPQSATRVSGSGTRSVADRETARLPNLDLVIMNPPFTRSVGGNLLFGGLPAAERRSLQKELAKRLRARFASATAGLGSAFVAAAAPNLRPGEGRMALVLPATVCTGPSWRQTRALIESEFDLDIVITSHDPKRWNFSDSTDLSESMLIATKRAQSQESESKRTVFINLWRNPEGVLDAHRTAAAISDTHPARIEDSGTALIGFDGNHVGEAFSVPRWSTSGGQWIDVQFARAELVRCARRLLSGGEVMVPGVSTVGTIPMRRIDAVGTVGPDRRDVRDGFEPTESVTAYPFVENHDTDRRRTISVEPNRYLAPLSRARPNRRLKPTSLLWPLAGRLLIAERLWLETARVSAMKTELDVLSNVWWPIHIGDELIEKMLAVWLNSSLGVLCWLGTRTSTRGGWVAMKKSDLAQMPVPDPSQLTDSQLGSIAEIYDQLANIEFEPFPRMAKCTSRALLDDGVSNAFNLPDLSPIRRLLATEPIVSNSRL